MLNVSILFCLLAGVLAQYTKNGPPRCPAIRPPPYNLSLMTGDWYEYKRSRNIRNNDEKCIKSKLEKSPNGAFRLITKYYIPSLSTMSTTVADVSSNNKGLAVTTNVPLIGPQYTPYTFLAVDRDYVIIWSCEIRGTQRFESSWVFTRCPSTPPTCFEDKIRNVYANYGLQMPDLYTNKYEECLETFASYQFEPIQTPAGMSLSCFFTPSCFSAKMRGLLSSLVPHTL